MTKLISPQAYASVEGVQTQCSRSFGSNSQIHERRVPPTGTQHVEGHQQEEPHHVETGIHQHALECNLLPSCKIPRGVNLIQRVYAATLSANGKDQVQRSQFLTLRSRRRGSARQLIPSVDRCEQLVFSVGGGNGARLLPSQRCAR